MIKIISTSEKLSIVLSRHGVSQKELAAKLGVTQANVSKKFKYNDWRESDVREICSLFDVECEMIFKFKNGDII